MASVIEMNGSELAELVASGERVFADFYSNTCGPCKMLSFVLADVAKSVEDTKIVKVNFDENKNILEKFSVTMYPTMILFEEGKEVKRLKGLQQKPLILKALEKNQ